MCRDTKNKLYGVRRAKIKSSAYSLIVKNNSLVSLAVVSECKDTRFECNSQPDLIMKAVPTVVSECKDTRFECNSQPTIPFYCFMRSCFRMQRYKI